MNFVQANKDLIEEITRLNGQQMANRGELLRESEIEIDNRSVFARERNGFEEQPGHTCEPENHHPDLDASQFSETQEQFGLPWRTFTSEEIEAIRNFSPDHTTQPLSQLSQASSMPPSQPVATELPGHIDHPHPSESVYNLEHLGGMLPVEDRFRHPNFMNQGWQFESVGFPNFTGNNMRGNVEIHEESTYFSTHHGFNGSGVIASVDDGEIEHLERENVKVHR